MALLEKYLVIKRSSLPKVGKGLFTRAAIPKGKMIVEYKGKVTAWKDVDDDKGRNRYIYYVNKHKVIDAKDDTNAIARYANDSKGPNRIDGIKNNSMYAIVNDRVFIKATKNIPAGAEILVGYGKNYWKVLKENKVVG